MGWLKVEFRASAATREGDNLEKPLRVWIYGSIDDDDGLGCRWVQ